MPAQPGKSSNHLIDTRAMPDRRPSVRSLQRFGHLWLHRSQPPLKSAPMTVRLSKSFRFEAAHDLPTFPDGHKCRRLHGHSFRFDVVVEGDVPPEKGYLIDYGEIKRVVDPIVRRLDHHYLNEIKG